MFLVTASIIIANVVAGMLAGIIGGSLQILRSVVGGAWLFVVYMLLRRWERRFIVHALLVSGIFGALTYAAGVWLQR